MKNNRPVKMSKKKHSFPEIGKTAAAALKAEKQGARFRPLFEAGTLGAKTQKNSAHDGKAKGVSPAAAIQTARQRGSHKGRQAAMFDAQSRYAGELVVLLEDLLASAEQFQKRRKQLLDSAGRWILALAQEISRKVIDYNFDQEASLLEDRLGRWVTSALPEPLLFGPTNSDALQVLLSAGEMLLPCEQTTADRLRQCLQKLDRLNAGSMRKDSGRPAESMSIAELVEQSLPQT